MFSDYLVRQIRDVGVADRPVVGGKGASLGELSRAGLPVPPGFIVTTQAFARALKAIDPAGAISREISRLSAADSGAVAAAAALIRERIAAAPLPGDIAEAITASYDALADNQGQRGPGTPVAIRSSATSEDSDDASFAGLQDTYLWVRGTQAVLDHVRKCWASLYNTESVTYRLRQRAGGDAMGVVVQRMVEPRSAGVMFTCSPATGDRSVIAIEASWGLGSALVSGEVTPDCYVVSKVTGEIVRRTVSAKHRLHRLHPAGSGTTAEDVPEHLRERACLTDAEVRALARIGKLVEHHYGTPQDIEWALAQAGACAGEEIVLLQSRSETVWAHRNTGPLATPKTRPADHVFEQLGRVVPVVMPEQ
jgi:pyruvate, water dikinase